MQMYREGSSIVIGSVMFTWTTPLFVYIACFLKSVLYCGYVTVTRE